MKKFFSVFLFIVSFTFLQLSSSYNTFAKKVVCVNAENDNGFLTMHEGWERQTAMPGDEIVVGGNLTNCLAMVANGDSLVIIAHGDIGPPVGRGFIWGGRLYVGFRKATDPPNQFLMELPPGFDMLINVKGKFCSCWSARNQPFGNLPMTRKLLNALNGARNPTTTGNTVVGFINPAMAGNIVKRTVLMRLTPLQSAIANNIINNCSFLALNIRWCICPPINRVPPPPLPPPPFTNHKTCLQAVLNAAIGGGKIRVDNIIYKKPIDYGRTLSLGDTCTCDCPNGPLIIIDSTGTPIDTVCACDDNNFESCFDCTIMGPNSIPINSTASYANPNPNGFWSISNYPPSNAYIVNSYGDSVVVNAGTNGGQFALYFTATDSNACPGQELCNKVIFVDDPLPVELSSLTSTVSGRNVTLNWTTVSEENNSGFDVERRDVISEWSIVNSEWSKVGFVQGHGTVSTSTNYSFEDRNISSGRYQYRLKQIDYNGNYQYYDLQNEVVIGTPDKFTLHQNYPNPFNPVTKINYDVANDGLVSLKIFDNNGKEVATLVNEFKTAGYWTVEFDGSGLASGAYYYRIQSGNFVDVKRMVLLK